MYVDDSLPVDAALVAGRRPRMPPGMPCAFELAVANQPERLAAAELLERASRPGQTIIADKAFAGAEFE